MARIISFIVLVAILLVMAALFFQVMAGFFVPLFLALKQAKPEGFSGHSRGSGDAQRRPAGAGARRGFEFSSVIEDCFLG
jgi:hypothetical protein